MPVKPLTKFISVHCLEFRLLLKRNLPLGIVRLLLDSYTRQQACTVWERHKSSFLNISNGVKQGGVISPRMFTIYILINFY